MEMIYKFIEKLTISQIMYYFMFNTHLKTIINHLILSNIIITRIHSHYYHQKRIQWIIHSVFHTQFLNLNNDHSIECVIVNIVLYRFSINWIYIINNIYLNIIILYKYLWLVLFLVQDNLSLYQMIIFYLKYHYFFHIHLILLILSLCLKYNF